MAITLTGNQILQLTGSTTDLRRHNRDAVLRAIRERGAVSRTEIADTIGLTNASVSRITKELIAVGLVEEGDRIALKGQAGRRQVSLRISKGGAFVIGIAVTLNAREVVIANGHGEIVAHTDCSDISLDKPTRALNEFARRAKILLAQSGIEESRIAGGAASVAGRVDPEDGRIIGADPLDWDGQRVAEKFEALLGLPFVSEGRAAALLQIEQLHGQAADLTDVLLINIGLKLGTAFMLDGRLLRGADNDAFALGRLKSGPRTTLDDEASGFAILNRLAAAGYPVPTGSDPGIHLRDLAEAPPESQQRIAQRAFRKSGEALGRAIAYLAPVLSPQVVILAGFVIRQSQYIDGVKARLRDCGIEIRTSQITTGQSAIHLALEHHIFNQRLEIERFRAA